MFGWFKLESPLKLNQRHWIEQRLEWLRSEFGDQRLQTPAITPTHDFFPDEYYATHKDAAVLFERVCQYMGVDRQRIDLKFYKSRAADDVAASFNPLPQRYALGLYQKQEERIHIWLEASQLDDAESVVATLAHELGHVHLLADAHCNADEPDHEQLTDLLVVYFGLGVFAANSVLREANWRSGNMSGWRMSARGYLTQAEIAYALALYAYARTESKPPWATHLRKDARALFDLELKDLIANGGVQPSEPPNGAEPDVATIGKSTAPVAYRQSISAELDKAEADDIEEESADPSEDREFDAVFTTGVQLAATGEHEKAVEAFTTVLDANPDDAEAWHLRATSQLGCGRYNEAIRDCTESLRIEPGELSVECTLAAAYIWSRRFSEAIPGLDTAIRADRKQPYP